MREIVDSRDLRHQFEEIRLIFILPLLKKADQTTDYIPLIVAPIQAAQQSRVGESACEKASKVALVPVEDLSMLL